MYVQPAVHASRHALGPVPKKSPDDACPPPFCLSFVLVCQADDIFDSPVEAEQHIPGWTKAVVVGQVGTISSSISIIQASSWSVLRCCDIVVS